MTRLGDDPAEDPEQQRVDVEQTRRDHQRQEARDDEVLERVHAEHLQGIELLADLACTEVGGDRGARDPREDDRCHPRPDLADGAEHEEAAEPVQGAEDRQEVRRLKARGRVTDADRRDQQREPAQSRGEQELQTNPPPYGYGGLSAERLSGG